MNGNSRGWRRFCLRTRRRPPFDVNWRFWNFEFLDLFYISFVAIYDQGLYSLIYKIVFFWNLWKSENWSSFIKLWKTFSHQMKKTSRVFLRNFKQFFKMRKKNKKIRTFNRQPDIIVDGALLRGWGEGLLLFLWLNNGPLLDQDVVHRAAGRRHAVWKQKHLKISILKGQITVALKIGKKHLAI